MKMLSRCQASFMLTMIRRRSFAIQCRWSKVGIFFMRFCLKIFLKIIRSFLLSTTMNLSTTPWSKSSKLYLIFMKDFQSLTETLSLKTSFLMSILKSNSLILEQPNMFKAHLLTNTISLKPPPVLVFQVPWVIWLLSNCIKERKGKNFLTTRSNQTCGHLEWHSISSWIKNYFSNRQQLRIWLRIFEWLDFQANWVKMDFGTKFFKSCLMWIHLKDQTPLNC